MQSKEGLLAELNWLTEKISSQVWILTLRHSRVGTHTHRSPHNLRGSSGAIGPSNFGGGGASTATGWLRRTRPRAATSAASSAAAQRDLGRTAINNNSEAKQQKAEQQTRPTTNAQRERLTVRSEHSDVINSALSTTR